MNYKETTEYLFSAMPSFQNVGGDAYKPGLERIRSFCNRLCDPQQSYPTIHVAGTNGKGSTSNMLAAVLTAAGYRVGLFTSPHLRDFRERMRVNGEMISEQEVVEFVAQHRDTMEVSGLSFFEMTAAMAFNHFAQQRVDIAIIECGLGGRLDATNIITPILSIITNIGIDHTQYLGDTLPKIAAEKGGIIKPNVEVIIGVRDEEYCNVFEQIATQNNAPILYAEERFSVMAHSEQRDFQHVELINNATAENFSIDLELRGAYQRHNLLTLLTAAERLNATTNFNIYRDTLERGLASISSLTNFIGRWHRLALSPLTICDTGHNTHGLREVTKQLATQKYERLICVIGLSRDKDLPQILALFPKDAHFVFTRPKVERAFAAEEIAEVAEQMGLSHEVVPTLPDALERARAIASAEDMIFIGGSNFVVAEIL